MARLSEAAAGQIARRAWDVLDSVGVRKVWEGCADVLVDFLDPRKASDEGVQVVQAALAGLVLAAASEAICRERGVRYDALLDVLWSDTESERIVERLQAMRERAAAVDNLPEPSAN